MTPKEYFKHASDLETFIKNKEIEIYQLTCLATSTNSRTDREAVQSSRVSDKVGDIGAKMADLREELKRLKKELFAIKADCIKVLDAVKQYNVLYYKVLHSRYFQHKSLRKIAKEQSYSYEYIRHVHGKALLIVEKILKNQKMTHYDTFKCDIM